MKVLGNKCPHNFKFTLVLATKTSELFAKTQKECDLWIRVFCRIIDINCGRREPFEDSYSPTWENILLRRKIDNKKLMNGKGEDFLRNVDYHSPNMDFSYLEVTGLVYKRIEELKMYHVKGWHKKYFRINFGEEKLEIFNSEKKSN